MNLLVVRVFYFGKLKNVHLNEDQVKHKVALCKALVKENAEMTYKKGRSTPLLTSILKQAINQKFLTPNA